MALGTRTPAHALDAVSRSPAIDSAPPVAPNLARAPEVHEIHRNFLETLFFKGISTPLALVLVVVQSRFLHASGRGTFVLVVLSVTILSRLLGQLGYAVTNRMQERGLELRRLVHAAFAVAAVLGAGGIAAIIGWGAFTPGVGGTVAAIRDWRRSGLAPALRRARRLRRPPDRRVRGRPRSARSADADAGRRPNPL